MVFRERPALFGSRLESDWTINTAVSVSCGSAELAVRVVPRIDAGSLGRERLQKYASRTSLPTGAFSVDTYKHLHHDTVCLSDVMTCLVDSAQCGCELIDPTSAHMPESHLLDGRKSTFWGQHRCPAQLAAEIVRDGGAVTRLELLARLTKSVPVRRMRYPEGFDRLDEVVRALEDDRCA